MGNRNHQADGARDEPRCDRRAMLAGMAGAVTAQHERIVGITSS